MSTATITEVWERYAAGRTPRRERNAAGAATWFNWTSHPDHGPDETVLGPLADRAVLELGCGTGCNLAHLATRGARCTGLDVSPTQLAKARGRWGHLPGLRFVEAEAVEYLTSRREGFDVVVSVFGPAWFTDPDVLLPLVRERLAPGGLFAFSHTHPGDAAPLPAKARISRYDLAPERWEQLLHEHGFAAARAETVPAPAGGGQRTLLVSAAA